MKLQKYMRGGLDVSEAEVGSLWTPYDDAQRALDVEREKVKGLEEWQRVVVGTGTDQEAVVRMAATEYTKTAVQCWKDENAKLTAKLATLQAQLAAWQTGKMHICLLCGRDKPCMTDEEAIAEGGPGKPCTFDPTPRELFDENKRLKAQLAALTTAHQSWTEVNARLREALKMIEAIICDRKLCGHFLAEEIREQTRHALADTDTKEHK